MSTNDHRVIQLPFQACAMGLHMSQAQKDVFSAGEPRKQGTLLDNMSSREEDILRAMVRLCLLNPITSDIVSLKNLIILLCFAINLSCRLPIQNLKVQKILH